MRTANCATILSLSVLASCLAPCLAAAKPSIAQVASQVDRHLAKEVGAAKSARADDETFLRRASLDVIGRNPTPVEVAAFVLDSSPDKRRRVVERLLASDHYGENWARYWSDVILARRVDQRAMIASEPLLVYLSNALNTNQHWDKIARDFITATGDVRKKGQTALIFAQSGEAVETAAEISRIFLGVQIQCAQCHDHKTDRWRREQFHEFAAFFPRIRLQAVKNPLVRSFEIVSYDRGRAATRPKKGQGSLEHYMPNLADPHAAGTLMTPTFFISSAQAKLGTTDQQRREQIAGWITSSDDPWFARALVNRLWAELVGEGFYEPIDDIGPDRKASAPETIDYLAQQFVASGYDIKWLVGTIMATEMYDRASRPRRNKNEQPFAANCPQPLRADALFDALATTLETTAPVPAKQKGGLYQSGPRQQFSQAFGYDPSEPRDEVAATIPQALYLMNSPQLNRAIDSRRSTSMLARLLKEMPDDQQLVGELYLRCLAREPKETEITACIEYVKQLNNRSQAFEDIVWSLVNSTEFRQRK